VSSVFEGIAGQTALIEQLRAAAARPVHAYLLVGPAGLQQRELVRGFAASLLCPDGGCGNCDTCRRVLSGVHPDLVEIQRAGAQLAVDDARRVVRTAYRRPHEAARQVVVVPDLHLARLAAPVLLKTLEEPPQGTVLVLLADSLTPELATIASRCVQLEISRVSELELVEWLESSGVDTVTAQSVAKSAGGSPEKAMLKVSDPSVEQRREMWRRVPTRLDGTGATVAQLAEELLEVTVSAVEPLRAHHAAEMDEMAAVAKATGERNATQRRETEDRHKREERRFRTDELRAGLAELAGAYRDRAVDKARDSSAQSDGKLHDLAKACDLVGTTATELVRNPNESLLLEGLFLRLSALSGS
jgi:DNA polymerase III subunit delta'